MQVYTSFALEPMSILGPSRYQDHIGSYLLAHVRLLWLLSIAASILLAVLIWLGQFINENVFALSVLIFVVFGLPFLLFPLLMRRVFYVLSKPGFAFLGSAIYASCLILIFYFTARFGSLNAVNSLVILSGVSLLSGLTLLFFLWNESKSSDRMDLKVVLHELWSFGKWLLISGILIGLATQSPLYLIGVLSDVEDAGVVRIFQTFIQPMMLISTAFSSLAAPSIAADFASGAYRSMQRKMHKFTFLLGGTAIAYEFMLVLFSGPLNHVLFAGKYSAFTIQIPIWGLVPVLLSFFWGGVIALQASQKPQAMLIISGFWASFCIITGLIVIPVWGVWGATVSIVTGFIAAFVITWILYWQWVHLVYMDDKRSIR